jgi:ABC-type oligopeptide transport system substrate-binding subunit
VRRRLVLPLLALCAGVALCVSAAFAQPQGQSRRGGTLRLLWGVEPDYVDPALATGARGSSTLLFAVCAKLFNTLGDAETGRPPIVNEVVRSYTVSTDGQTYTFELKRTFRFHTSEPVTAQSFADAFNRNAKLGLYSFANRRHFMDEIVGVEAAMAGRARSISGVQVLGRFRLRIRLTRPAGDFVTRLTMWSFCPILPGTPIDPAGIDKPPASGPYYVAEHVSNRLIRLERNPNYHGGRPANPDHILWTINTDAAERLRATEEDRNDFTPVFGYPDAVVHRLADKYGVNRPGGRLLRIPSGLTNYGFAFNPRPNRPAFAGRAQAPLRKAINFALDRRALANMHPYLTVRRTDRLLPAPLTQAPRLYPLHGPDLTAARKWLARAKRRPKELTLYAPNTFLWGVESARVFTANMKELGIDVTTRYFDFTTLGEKLNKQGEPWDVAWLPWGAWYLDPAGAVLPLLRGTRYEARINAVNQVAGPGRAKAWADLEADLMRNDPPVATYADANALILISRNLGCLRLHRQVDLDLAGVCKLDRR